MCDPSVCRGGQLKSATLPASEHQGLKDRYVSPGALDLHWASLW